MSKKFKKLFLGVACWVLAYPFEGKAVRDPVERIFLGDLERRPVFLEQAPAYSFSEEILEVLDATPDVPLNVYLQVAQSGLLDKLETAGESFRELKDKWKIVKEKLLEDPEALIKKDDLEVWVTGTRLDLKKLEKTFQALRTHQTEVATLKTLWNQMPLENFDWFLNSLASLDTYYETYVQILMRCARIEDPSSAFVEVTALTSPKAILTGEVFQKTPSPFYRINQKLFTPR